MNFRGYLLKYRKESNCFCSFVHLALCKRGQEAGSLLLQIYSECPRSTAPAVLVTLLDENLPVYNCNPSPSLSSLETNQIKTDKENPPK